MNPRWNFMNLAQDFVKEGAGSYIMFGNCMF